jgi:hypothetical protein
MIALRINALVLLGEETASLEDIFPGVAFTGIDCSRRFRIVPVSVMKSATAVILAARRVV